MNNIYNDSGSMVVTVQEPDAGPSDSIQPRALTEDGEGDLTLDQPIAMRRAT